MGASFNWVQKDTKEIRGSLEPMWDTHSLMYCVFRASTHYPAPRSSCSGPHCVILKLKHQSILGGCSFMQNAKCKMQMRASPRKGRRGTSLQFDRRHYGAMPIGAGLIIFQISGSWRLHGPHPTLQPMVNQIESVLVAYQD